MSSGTNKERLQQNNTKIEELIELVQTKVEPSESLRTHGKYFVKVIDYDGTVLKEEKLNTGDTFILPEAPSHNGIIFQEWCSTQEIIDGVITIENSNVMVGASYTTVSGLNEFDIELTRSTGLDVTFNMDGTKDWGDGTSDDLTTHTYANYAKYTIKCNGTSTNGTLFGQSNGNVSAGSAVINYYCTDARLTTSSLKGGMLPFCYSLRSIIVSNKTTSIGSHPISYDYSLRAIVFPALTTVSSYAIYDARALRDVVLPKLKKIASSGFLNAYGLKGIIFPSSVSTIEANACSNQNSAEVYDFSKCTAVPTLGNTNSFNKINKIAKIIVPDALYDEWIVATNWTAYTDYIYKASEV